MMSRKKIIFHFVRDSCLPWQCPYFLKVFKMLLRRLLGDENLVEIDHGKFSFHARHDHVNYPLERARSAFQSKWHTHQAIEVVMRCKFVIIPFVFFDFRLPLSAVSVEGGDHGWVPKNFDAFGLPVEEI